MFEPPRQGCVTFIMLNPSMADAIDDDATVRRCMGYAELWGFCNLAIGNLFAWRETDASRLFHAADPIGPENDFALELVAKPADLIVCAWGALPTQARPRAEQVLEQLRRFQRPIECLGKTKGGEPRHPVRLGYDVLRVAI